jgi:predicted DNA-binding ArsR family transcriptional regulator
MNEKEYLERINELEGQILALAELLANVIKEKTLSYEMLDDYYEQMGKFLESRRQQTIDVLKAKIRELEDEQ